eukprot:scaffold8783_cov24-Tisochrysis_lutea.AAC.5
MAPACKEARACFDVMRSALAKISDEFQQYGALGTKGGTQELQMRGAAAQGIGPPTLKRLCLIIDTSSLGLSCLDCSFCDARHAYWYGSAFRAVHHIFQPHMPVPLPVDRHITIYGGLLQRYIALCSAVCYIELKTDADTYVPNVVLRHAWPILGCLKKKLLAALKGHSLAI